MSWNKEGNNIFEQNLSQILHPPLMMTDKTVLNFQLAQKYSKIQILMPQIPPLMIRKTLVLPICTMKAKF